MKIDPYYLVSGTKVNESVNADYILVYRDNKEEYDLMVEYRKLNEDNKKRIEGYIQALMEMQLKGI